MSQQGFTAGFGALKERAAEISAAVEPRLQSVCEDLKAESGSWMSSRSISRWMKPAPRSPS